MHVAVGEKGRRPGVTQSADVFPSPNVPRSELYSLSPLGVTRLSLYHTFSRVSLYSFLSVDFDLTQGFNKLTFESKKAYPEVVRQFWGKFIANDESYSCLCYLTETKKKRSS